MQQVKAVVALSKGAPVSLETILVPDPGPGEAVVRIQACGVCHTDLHYREGGINDDFPFLLGHEAAGIVEAVGDGAPGDAAAMAGQPGPGSSCGSSVLAATSEGPYHVSSRPLTSTVLVFWNASGPSSGPKT